MTRPFSDELISAYLDGELSADEQADVERVLRDNAEYRQMYEELRTLRNGLQSLPRYQLDEDFAQRVLRRAERTMLSEPGASSAAPVMVPERQTVLLRRWQRGFWLMSTCAAALLIALLLNLQFEKTRAGNAVVARNDMKSMSAADSRAPAPMSIPSSQQFDAPQAQVEAQVEAAQVDTAHVELFSDQTMGDESTLENADELTKGGTMGRGGAGVSPSGFGGGGGLGGGRARYKTLARDANVNGISLEKKVEEANPHAPEQARSSSEPDKVPTPQSLDGVESRSFLKAELRRFGTLEERLADKDAEREKVDSSDGWGYGTPVIQLNVTAESLQQHTFQQALANHNIESEVLLSDDGALKDHAEFQKWEALSLGSSGKFGDAKEAKDEDLQVLVIEADRAQIAAALNDFINGPANEPTSGPANGLGVLAWSANWADSHDAARGRGVEPFYFHRNSVDFDLGFRGNFANNPIDAGAGAAAKPSADREFHPTESAAKRLAVKQDAAAAAKPPDEAQTSLSQKKGGPPGPPAEEPKGRANMIFPRRSLAKLPSAERAKDTVQQGGVSGRMRRTAEEAVRDEIKLAPGLDAAPVQKLEDTGERTSKNRTRVLVILQAVPNPSVTPAGTQPATLPAAPSTEPDK